MLKNIVNLFKVAADPSVYLWIVGQCVWGNHGSKLQSLRNLHKPLATEHELVDFISANFADYKFKFHKFTLFSEPNC